ncbi:hypothetical protein BROC_01719 [Candidatus Brocadiaceae bacterium]|nr:hypothetical protein BROC_01719 [Candidatus Brocadiaceae bacterium]
MTQKQAILITIGFRKIIPMLRDHVEELYQICHDLVDKKFRSQIKSMFASCYSEMHFCAAFKKHLRLDVTHPLDEGPDYYLKDIDCWAEVTTLSNGKKGNLNSIPQQEYGKESAYPKNQIILRITNSFTEKAKKICDDIKKGIIKDSQRIIICISGGWLASHSGFPYYGVGGFPAVVEALLPIGNMVLCINKENMSVNEITFEYRAHVDKVEDKGTQPIKTDYLINPEYSHISAIIYSYADITSSIDPQDLGRDFFIIHNPLAKNRLPLGSIKYCM